MENRVALVKLALGEIWFRLIFKREPFPESLTVTINPMSELKSSSALFCNLRIFSVTISVIGLIQCIWPVF